MKHLRPWILLLFALSSCARDSPPATPPAGSPAVNPASAATAPLAARAPAGAEHDEQAGAAAVAAEAPPAGQRWAADAPLRAGMARVRVAAQALEPLQHGQMPAAEVRAHANEIEAAVNEMFAKCHLPPQPDAALHPLLAKLLIASQALRDQPAEAGPLSDVTEVLSRYPQLFDDGDWPAPVK